MKTFRFLIAVLVLLTVFVSCSDDSTGPQEDEASVVNEETKLIEADELQDITEVTEDEIVFSGNSVAIDTYQAGDVLVSAPSDVAEYGFLRMVDDISQNGNDIVVTTSQARLEDAFEELHFDVSAELRTTDIRNSTKLMDGVQFVQNSRDPYEFEYQLNMTIPISNNIDIEIDGNLLLTMGFDFDVDISLLNGLHYIKAGGHSTADSDLELSINGEFSYENEYELYEHSFAPGFTYVTPTVPPIPIVFVPKVVILLEVNADGQASISTSVSSDASIEAGLIYDKPDWSPYTDKQISFDYYPPSLTASLSAYAAAGPRFELNLYNVAGPYVKPMGYLNIEANIQSTPWWSLYGGFKVDAGVKFEIIGYVQDYEIEDIIDYNYLIAEAGSSTNMPPFSPSNPQPGDNSNLVPLDTDLSWECSDPEGDPLTYDVYFGTDQEPPLASEEQSGTIYNPGTLEEGTTYYWKIVANDDHGNINEGNVWSFTSFTDDDNGIYYGDFGLTELTYEGSSDWDQIINSIFGNEYRVADWNDLVAFYNNGGDLLDLFDGLGLTEYGNNSFVTLNGDPTYSSTRYYFASRHEHNPPSGFLAHANIDNYLISLGSWSGNRKILAVKTSF